MEPCPQQLAPAPAAAPPSPTHLRKNRVVTDFSGRNSQENSVLDRNGAVRPRGRSPGGHPRTSSAGAHPRTSSAGAHPRTSSEGKRLVPSQGISPETGGSISIAGSHLTRGAAPRPRPRTDKRRAAIRGRSETRSGASVGTSTARDPRAHSAPRQMPGPSAATAAELAAFVSQHDPLHGPRSCRLLVCPGQIDPVPKAAGGRRQYRQEPLGHLRPPRIEPVSTHTRT